MLGRCRNGRGSHLISGWTLFVASRMLLFGNGRHACAVTVLQRVPGRLGLLTAAAAAIAK